MSWGETAASMWTGFWTNVGPILGWGGVIAWVLVSVWGTFMAFGYLWLMIGGLAESTLRERFLMAGLGLLGIASIFASIVTLVWMVG